MLGRASSLSLSLVLATLPLLGGEPAPPRGTELRFAPAEGLALRKQFASSRDWDIVSYSASQNGEEQGADMDQSSQTETSLELVDTYVGVADGRPTTFDRTYGALDTESANQHSFNGQEHEFESEGTSEIEDVTVRFEWDEEEEAYAASCEEEDLDEDVLEELRADLDFLALLPPGAVEEDDEWSLDPEAFRGLMDYRDGIPIDYVSYADGELQERREPDEDYEAPEVETEHEGELTARFAGTREVEGRELAVIEVAGELTTTSRSEGSRDMEHGTSTFSNESVSTIELEGECLWDVEAGHMASFRVTGETRMEARTENTSEFFDQVFELENESEMEGELRMEARFTPLD